MEALTPDWFEALRAFDTPTICNAIETVQGRRGFDRFTRGTLVASAPNAKPLVGYARTARIAAATPSEEPAGVVRERRMAYYRYMAEAPRPCVVVIEDADWPNGVGAFWGEINTAVHAGFGLAGVLTNGLVRDLDALAPNFPVLAGAIGPSHAFVRVTDFACPVRVFGLDVDAGEIVHADRHGAVVIPADVLPNLMDGIRKMVDTEALILGPAGRDDFNFERFRDAWETFERARI